MKSAVTIQIRYVTKYKGINGHLQMIRYIIVSISYDIDDILV